MKFLKKILNKPNWQNLRSTKPISRKYGLDRGTAIDRVYIENFLSKNAYLITDNILEIADSYYSKKFVRNVYKYEVLHANSDNPRATIIGDLTDISTLPKNRINCFICTQTLIFIYDFQSAIRGCYHLLKQNGVMLTTVAV